MKALLEILGFLFKRTKEMSENLDENTGIFPGFREGAFYFVKQRPFFAQWMGNVSLEWPRSLFVGIAKIATMNEKYFYREKEAITPLENGRMPHNGRIL